MVNSRPVVPIVHTPDNDGVAPLLAPELRDARQAEQPLRLLQIAIKPEGQHDRTVTPRTAFPREDVIDDRGVESRSAYDIGPGKTVTFQHVMKVVREFQIDDVFRIQERADVRAPKQAIQQFLRQPRIRQGAVQMRCRG